MASERPKEWRAGYAAAEEDIKRMLRRYADMSLARHNDAGDERAAGYMWAVSLLQSGEHRARGNTNDG